MKSESMSVGALRVRQAPLLEDAVRDGDYDMAVVVVSWESRASALSNLFSDWRGTVDVLRFASADPTTEKKKDLVEANIVKRLDHFELRRWSRATDFKKNIQMLDVMIRERYAQIGRPLKILIDISCLPKNYLLFVIGLGFKRELVGRFDLLYSEGRYHYDTETAAAPTILASLHGTVSEGEWSSAQIPYLEGTQYIPEVRDLVASMGGELTLSVPFIQRFEPRRLELLTVKHSDERMPAPKDERERRALTELETQPLTRKTSFEIEDVIGVAKHIVTFCQEAPQIPTTAIAIGPKTHAIALAAVALYIPEIEVVCRVPNTYVPSEVSATGRSFHFSLEDRFEPHTYIKAVT